MLEVQLKIISESGINWESYFSDLPIGGYFHDKDLDLMLADELFDEELEPTVTASSMTRTINDLNEHNEVSPDNSFTMAGKNRRDFQRMMTLELGESEANILRTGSLNVSRSSSPSPDFKKNSPQRKRSPGPAVVSETKLEYY